MKPFLRPVDRGKLAPVGWVSEPAGTWAGKAVDVVYDPGRHDVTFLRGDTTQDVRDGLASVGYRQAALDGRNEMWVRDRATTLVTDALNNVDSDLTAVDAPLDVARAVALKRLNALEQRNPARSPGLSL